MKPLAGGSLDFSYVTVPAFQVRTVISLFILKFVSIFYSESRKLEFFNDKIVQFYLKKQIHTTRKTLLQEHQVFLQLGTATVILRTV